MRCVKTFLIAAVLALAVPAAFAQTVTFEVEGQTREAIVYTPTSASASGKAPLVLSFHGRGDNMENFQHTAMHRAWPEAVVVYFQGLPGRGRLRGWQVERGQNDDRDLKLVDAALAALRRRFDVDDARIYATGFSNGANFTYLLWAERPGVFAAYAPVAGRLQPSVRLTQPRPVFHVAGRQDPQILFADQEAAIEAARRANGSAAPVETWIHPGGHTYPAGTSQRIAAFFQDHRSTR